MEVLSTTSEEFIEKVKEEVNYPRLKSEACRNAQA